MSRQRALVGLCLLGFAATSCALAGYDFGDYQRATTNTGGSASTRETTAVTGGADGTEGGQAPGSTPGSVGEAGSDASPSAGAPAEHPIGPEPTTFGVGGGPGTEAPAEGGASGASSSGCAPRTCEDLAVECGGVDDGCGQALDCGGCFWWFLECRENLCQFTE
jgi:hypothetical protein